VLPICADYTRHVRLPGTRSAAARRVAYYPGSTLGNFVPEDARRFLRTIGEVCGPGGGLIIGTDQKKDPLMLHRAYNDALGITADFNLNVLRRLNRELGANFVLDRFATTFATRALRAWKCTWSAGPQIVRVAGRYPFNAARHLDRSLLLGKPGRICRSVCRARVARRTDGTSTAASQRRVPHPRHIAPGPLLLLIDYPSTCCNVAPGTSASAGGTNFQS
jgi:hypothetical protein